MNALGKGTILRGHGLLLTPSVFEKLVRGGGGRATSARARNFRRVETLPFPYTTRGSGRATCGWPQERPARQKQCPFGLLRGTEGVGWLLQTHRLMPLSEECASMRLRFSKWLPAAVQDGRRPLRKICRSSHAPAAFTRGGHCRRFGGGQRSKEFSCRPRLRSRKIDSSMGRYRS